MQIQFRAAADGPLPRLQAQIVDQDSLPEGIEPALKEGAAAARFAGKTGQVFEAFVERGGRVVRLALAGAGKPDEAERIANLEKTGAALSARFLTAGEKELALDLTGSNLSADQAAALLLGPGVEPNADGTCWRKMMSAMPRVNPSITGHGINVTVRPSLSRPATTTMMPANTVTMGIAATP